MKRIKFNKVTWYSKLGAIILFIAVVPTLTFYIGTKYQETIDVFANLTRIQDSVRAAKQPPVAINSSSCCSSGGEGYLYTQ